MSPTRIQASSQLANVRYEIRGPLARRAAELEKAGHEIVKLNIGNPGAFGFRAPETMRLAMIENLRDAEPYCHQKGIFSAREAVVMQQQSRGIMDASAEDVFIGNGVSELILFSLRALLNRGDEVLVPSPDYPLWTAATHLADGTAVHYPCLPENNWLPDLDKLARLVTPRTRAMVIISPNNPTGAVYPREVLAKMVDIAESHDVVVFSDEIYDQMTYEGAEYTPVATLARHTLCGTFSGLSKVYRACGFRVGWLSFSGEKDSAREYLMGLDTIMSLRLCSNVVGQWAVQTALGGYQSIRDLVRPGGRLFQTRAAILGWLQAQQIPVRDPAPRGHVRLRAGRQQQAAEFQRPTIRARPARAQARAHRPRHQLQRALLRSLPHHASARRRHHGPGLRTHGGTAGRLRRRGGRLGGCAGVIGSRAREVA